MAADKGKRKRPDFESDEISVNSQPCKTNRSVLGDFEEEYDEEGWFIGYKYIGDHKAGNYVSKNTDDDHEADKEYSTYAKEADHYSDEECNDDEADEEYSTYVKAADYSDEECNDHEADEEYTAYVKEADHYSDEECSTGCSHVNGEKENSSDFEEEYDDEGWFIGYKYKGDTARYMYTHDDHEANEDYCGYVKEADYSDEEEFNHHEADQEYIVLRVGS